MTKPRNINIKGGWIEVWSILGKWDERPRWHVCDGDEVLSAFTSYAAAQREARRILKESHS